MVKKCREIEIVIKDGNFIHTTHDYFGETCDELMEIIKKFIDARPDFSNLEVLSAKENGQIIIIMLEALPANKRGLFLLNFEKSLKFAVDEGITVWCEPVGDKSKLRALRGVNITT